MASAAPAAQGMNLGDIAAPDVGQQAADGGLLRRDRDINDAGRFHQIHVGHPVDQRHHLVGAHALGQHRRQNIGLVVIGHGAEHIHVLDVFLPQQIFVGGVALQHDGAANCSDNRGGLRVALDHFDLEPLFQRLRASRAPICPPPAMITRLTIRSSLRSSLTIARVFLRAAMKNTSSSASMMRIALRDDRSALAEDRGHPGFDARHSLRQGAQRLTDQGAALVGFDTHQPHLTIGEIQHLQAPRDAR
jgi:hypothetical protein